MERLEGRLRQAEKAAENAADLARQKEAWTRKERDFTEQVENLREKVYEQSRGIAELKKQAALVDTLTEQKAALEKKYAALQQEHEALSGRETRLQGQLEAYREQVEELQEENSKAETLAAKSASLMEELRDELAFNVNQVEELKKDQKTNEATIQELRAELKRAGKLEDQVENLKSELWSVSQDLEAAGDAQAALQRMEKETAQLNRQLAEREQQAKELADALKAQQVESARLTQRLESARQQLMQQEKMQDDVDELLRENERLGRMLTNLERAGRGVDSETSKELRSRITDLNSRLESILKEVETLNE
jgi:DNA repair exonuclease SbcCD ATPase subunit